MKVLHFYNNSRGNDNKGDVNVRLQRMMQLDLMNGNEVVLLINEGSKTENMWIPNKDDISIEFYDQSIQMTYLFPKILNRDFVGLKKTFNDHGCDLVHAHNLDCGIYAYRKELPMVFDDWEYFIEFYNHQTSFNRKKWSKILRFYRQWIAPLLTKELVCNVPSIVTNKNVENEYKNLNKGAQTVTTIPNVPLKCEVPKAKSEKFDHTSTVYIGNYEVDSRMPLRDVSGLKELWKKHCDVLGDLVVYGGKNFIPHLDVMDNLSKFHFNLLYWNPIPVHRYYLQNKAFMASAVGVPTIISSKLQATINLLGDFALIADDHDDVLKIIREYDHSKRLVPSENMFLEYYSGEFEKCQM